MQESYKTREDLRGQLWREVLIQLIFTYHAFLVILVPGLFVIPSSLWPQRIEFHLGYCLFIFSMFYLWGSLWTFKFKDKIYTICIVDSAMQLLRGYPLYDPRNYEHAFTTEFLERFGIAKINSSQVVLLMKGFVALSLALFVLKIVFGIVLY